MYAQDAKITAQRLFTLVLVFFLPLTGKSALAQEKSDPWIAPPIPQQYAGLLGKGLDVDWAKTGKGMSSYSLQDVKSFKSAGLSHIRIRVKDEASKTLLKELDIQIKDCVANRLIPVLAYQANDFKNQPTDMNVNHVVAWWAAIAGHFKDASPMLSFDLLIEATDAVNKAPDRLNVLYEKVVAAIRKTNPKRIVFISPRLRSDPAYLHELRIPSQHNNHLMAEWHFYASGPAKDNPNKLWTTGTPAEKQIILSKILAAKAWEQKTGILTWVGAWMPGNYNKADEYTVAEQVVFARFVASALDRAKIPFAVNSDTKFYDRDKKVWIAKLQPVLNVILHPNGEK